MTSKTIDGVSRELLERIASHCKFWIDHPYLEAISDVEAELRALLAAPEAPRQDRLPCDVRLPPATTIRRGCKVETLMHAIQLREGRNDIDCIFKSAPLSPDHSGGEGEVLPEPITVYLPPRVPVVVPKSPSEATSEYMMGAAYNMAIDNCQKQIEEAGGKVKELNQ